MRSFYAIEELQLPKEDKKPPAFALILRSHDRLGLKRRIQRVNNSTSSPNSNPRDSSL